MVIIINNNDDPIECQKDRFDNFNKGYYLCIISVQFLLVLCPANIH